MEYTKHTWIPQELITAEKLNNIENGFYDLENSVNNIQTINTLSETNLNTVASDLTNYKGLWYVALDSEHGGTTNGYPTNDGGIWLIEVLAGGSRGLIRANINYTNRNFIASVRNGIIVNWEEVGNLNNGGDLVVNSISYNSGGVKVVTEYGGEV